MGIISDAAKTYRDSGICVLPANGLMKKPICDWKSFQSTPPTAEMLEYWYNGNDPEAICALCGEASGNLEFIDFDGKGELLDAWQALINERVPALLTRLFIEKSPSGGFHIAYRSTEPVDGNQKLAMRWIPCPDDKEVEIYGKKYKPRKNAEGAYGVLICLIETRGRGGIILIYPSPGYAAIQNTLPSMPTITPEEREILLSSARELNEYFEVEHHPNPTGLSTSTAGDDLRPGDDFNRRVNFRSILENMGWTYIDRNGENDRYRRPGKDKGHSATVKVVDGVPLLYVFTSSTEFEPSKAYTPFQVVALHDHHGDYSKAAAALRQAGYGTQRPAIPQADISGIMEKVNSLPLGLDGQNPADLSPIDVGEDLDIMDIFENPVPRPGELIGGVAFCGSKISLSSNSKGHKTYAQMHLGICIATGTPWLGFPVKKGRVFYVNLELSRYSFQQRIFAICEKLGVKPERGMFTVRHLRGKGMTIEKVAHMFESIPKNHYDLFCLDPLYKMLGDRDENKAGDMSGLFNLLEGIASRIASAYIVAHHYAKGNSAGKEAMDRSAGSGVISRDGDTIISLTDLATPNHVTMDLTLRDFPPQAPKVLEWNYPLFIHKPGMDATDLKQKQGSGGRSPNQEITDDEVLACVPDSFEKRLKRDDIVAIMLRNTGQGETKCNKALSSVIDRLLLKVEFERLGDDDRKKSRYWKTI